MAHYYFELRSVQCGLFAEILWINSITLYAEAPAHFDASFVSSILLIFEYMCGLVLLCTDIFIFTVCNCTAASVKFLSTVCVSRFELYK